jgi:hypothetical protein
MSVYSERFLQLNIVNYKLILIRNHKRKVFILSINLVVDVGRKAKKQLKESIATYEEIT